MAGPLDRLGAIFKRQKTSSKDLSNTDRLIFLYGSPDLAGQYSSMEGTNEKSFLDKFLHHLKPGMVSIGKDNMLREVSFPTDTNTYTFDNAVFSEFFAIQSFAQQQQILNEKIATLQKDDVIFILGHSDEELLQHYHRLVAADKTSKAKISFILVPSEDSKELNKINPNPLLDNSHTIKADWSNVSKIWWQALSSDERLGHLGDLGIRTRRVFIYGHAALNSGLADNLVNMPGVMNKTTAEAGRYAINSNPTMQLESDPLIRYELDQSISPNSSNSDALPHTKSMREALTTTLASLTKSDVILIIGDDERALPHYYRQLCNACKPINIKPTVCFVVTNFVGDEEDNVYYPVNEHVSVNVITIQKGWPQMDAVWQQIMASKLTLASVPTIVIPNQVTFQTEMAKLREAVLGQDADSSSSTQPKLSHQAESATAVSPPPPDVKAWHMPSKLDQAKQGRSLFLRYRSVPEIQHTDEDLNVEPSLLRRSDPT
jgi:hypothetical protein